MRTHNLYMDPKASVLHHCSVPGALTIPGLQSVIPKCVPENVIVMQLQHKFIVIWIPRTETLHDSIRRRSIPPRFREIQSSSAML